MQIANQQYAHTHVTNDERDSPNKTQFDDDNNMKPPYSRLLTYSDYYCNLNICMMYNVHMQEQK